MTIFIAALLLAGIMAITSTMGKQLALADGDNNHNKLKINQGANQDNKCKLNNKLEKEGLSDNTFACANVAFNIVCLPGSVCIVPNENTPYKLVTPT